MIPECYKYWVEDNELQIPSKEFNNFKDALDYAKDGLVTFVHEVPCTAGDCCDDEDEIVWSWDDTWNDDEACAAVAKRHPDFCPECGRNQELCECGKFKDQDLFLNLEDKDEFEDTVEDDDMTDEEFAKALYEAKKAKEQELNDEEILNGKYDEDEAKKIRSAKAAADLEKDFFDMQNKKNLKEDLDPDIVVEEWEGGNLPDEYLATVYRKSDETSSDSNSLLFVFSKDFINRYCDISYDVERDWVSAPFGDNMNDGYEEDSIGLRDFDCRVKDVENCPGIKIYYFDKDAYNRDSYMRPESSVSREEFMKELNITDTECSEIIKEAYKLCLDTMYDLAEEGQLVNSEDYIYDDEPSWEDYRNDD